ncbi:hypothetical protein L3081_23380 [Colwellia sp. MSW7]|uniref:Uncharacterized protein n=1 Tax=Colwellia maritima TaxID=2912588 RepID=A0ABS9X9Q1_9GAMM|nr:hypothetical protein [Colwellia maritima]MCI2285782.1 hypothetical protein [Colwellia maritima]
MTTKIDRQKARSKTIKYKSLAALILTTLISGCGDEDGSAPKEGSVNFILASVDGGSCTLHDPYNNMSQFLWSSKYN